MFEVLTCCFQQKAKQIYQRPRPATSPPPAKLLSFPKSSHPGNSMRSDCCCGSRPFSRSRRRQPSSTIVTKEQCLGNTNSKLLLAWLPDSGSFCECRIHVPHFKTLSSGSSHYRFRILIVESIFPRFPLFCLLLNVTLHSDLVMFCF